MRRWLGWFFLSAAIGLTAEVSVAWTWFTLLGSTPWTYPNSPWGYVDPVTFWCWGFLGVFWAGMSLLVKDLWCRYPVLFAMGCVFGPVLEWSLGYFFDLAGYTLHLYPGSPWIYFTPMLIPSHGVVAAAYAWISRMVKL